MSTEFIIIGCLVTFAALGWMWWEFINAPTVDDEDDWNER